MTELTPGQRRIVIFLVLAVIVVFAMLAGIIITSLQNWQNPPPAILLPLTTSFPTPFPSPSPTLTPTPEGLWTQVQAARLFYQIAHQVQTLRGLSPHAAVPLNFLSQEDIVVLLRPIY